MDAFPFGVGEPRLFRGKRDDFRFGVILRRSFSPEGRSRSSACLFAAGGNCLVRPPPHRPPEPKVPLFYGPCHREHQPPDLRHGERDQAGMNLAVNQTLVRSINTSVVALLPVASILFIGAFLLGAGTLRDISLALFVGIIAGTYSSVF